MWRLLLEVAIPVLAIGVIIYHNIQQESIQWRILLRMKDLYYTFPQPSTQTVNSAFQQIHSYLASATSDFYPRIVVGLLMTGIAARLVLHAWSKASAHKTKIQTDEEIGYPPGTQTELQALIKRGEQLAAASKNNSIKYENFDFEKAFNTLSAETQVIVKNLGYQPGIVTQDSHTFANLVRPVRFEKLQEVVLDIESARKAITNKDALVAKRTNGSFRMIRAYDIEKLLIVLYKAALDKWEVASTPSFESKDQDTNNGIRFRSTATASPGVLVAHSSSALLSSSATVSTTTNAIPNINAAHQERPKNA